MGGAPQGGVLPKADQEACDFVNEIIHVNKTHCNMGKMWVLSINTTLSEADC